MRLGGSTEICVAPFQDAPNYGPALLAIMILFIVFAVCIVLQSFLLIWAQKRKEKKRVSLGLPEKIVDRSMDVSYKDASADQDDEHDEVRPEEASALEDQTDRENLYFT